MIVVSDTSPILYLLLMEENIIVKLKPTNLLKEPKPC